MRCPWHHEGFLTFWVPSATAGSEGKACGSWGPEKSTCQAPQEQLALAFVHFCKHMRSLMAEQWSPSSRQLGS